MSFVFNPLKKDMHMVSTTLVGIGIIYGSILLYVVLTKLRPQIGSKRAIVVRAPQLLVYLLLAFVVQTAIGTPLAMFTWCSFEPKPPSWARILWSCYFIIFSVSLYSMELARVWLLKIRHTLAKLRMQNSLHRLSWADMKTNWWYRLTEDGMHRQRNMFKIIGVYLAITSVPYVLILIFVTERLSPLLNMIILAPVLVLALALCWMVRTAFDGFGLRKEFGCVGIIFAIVFVAYAILYVTLHHRISVCLWVNITQSLSLASAITASLTHLYFALKSYKSHSEEIVKLETILGSFRSMKLFLEFLVSEFSVENLEFYQLTMRWRRKLVEHHERIRLPDEEEIHDFDGKKIGISNNLMAVTQLNSVDSNWHRPSLETKMYPFLTFEYLDRILPSRDDASVTKHMYYMEDASDNENSESRSSTTTTGTNPFATHLFARPSDFRKPSPAPPLQFTEMTKIDSVSATGTLAGIARALAIGSQTRDMSVIVGSPGSCSTSRDQDHIPESLDVEVSNDDVHVVPLSPAGDMSTPSTPHQAVGFSGRRSSLSHKEAAQVMTSTPTLSWNRWVEISQEINVSSQGFDRLERFFERYPTPSKFQLCTVKKFDRAFDEALREVWKNLSDSKSRFISSQLFKDCMSAVYK